MNSAALWGRLAVGVAFSVLRDADAQHTYYNIDNAIADQRSLLYRSFSPNVEEERDYNKQFFFHSGSDDLDLQLLFGYLQMPHGEARDIYRNETNPLRVEDVGYFLYRSRVARQI